MNCLLLLALLDAVAFKVQGLEFNRQLVGVKFDPYIKKTLLQSHTSSKDLHTFEDVKVMLQVVSTKFSRIYFENVDTLRVPYERNTTYYHHTRARGRTAEAAALINRERDKKVLTVIVGIWIDYNNDSRTETDVAVALESVHIANNIFPGTVEGILFSRGGILFLKGANLTLSWIKRIRQLLPDPNITIGSYGSCPTFGVSKTILSSIHPDFANLNQLEDAIHQSVDFFICHYFPPDKVAAEGAKLAVNKIRNQLRLFRLNLREANEKIVVMLDTFWRSDGRNAWETIENFKDYWTAVNSFAVEENYPVWLDGAFEMPDNTHQGWWKLTSHHLSRNVSGYVEKISGRIVELPPVNEEPIHIIPFGNESINSFTETPSKSNQLHKSYGLSLFYLFVSIAIVILVGLAAVFSVRRVYLNHYIRASGPLTTKELNEFINGTPNKAPKQSSNCVYENLMNRSALKMPYNQGNEIPLTRLKILTDQFLGMGRFGIVFKARIENESGTSQTIAALKTVRPGCPSLEFKAMLSEIKVLQWLGNHPNVIKMLGAYTAQIRNGIVYLATELCPLGSLKKLLQNSQFEIDSRDSRNLTSDAESTGHKITLSDLLRWSYEIACGMIHLGERDVIHADLAARNILVSSDGTAKLSDFGLSRRLYDTIYMKREDEPLPWKWMAIESLKLSQFSFQSDVWSFGVTLWEIFSLGDDPYPGLRYNLGFVEHLEREGVRLGQPRLSTGELYSIMQSCWNLQPNERPDFVCIRDTLEIVIRESTKKSS